MEDIFLVSLGLFVFLWCTGGLILAVFVVRNIKRAEPLPHRLAVPGGDIYR
jgi:hypothetical protein